MSVTLARRAFLGAELPGDSEAFTAGGVVIAAALAGGMAERAGLRGGDRLVAIAGLEIRTLPELALALQRAGAASITTLAYVRDEVRHVCTIEVAHAAPEDGAILGELVRDDDVRLRTLAIVPPDPRALVLVIQGIACESIELQADTPLAGLVDGWTRAGIASLRFDKRGVGDSEGGPCNDVDFATELGDARAALVLAEAEAARLGVPLVVFGHSVGGIIAAILAGEPHRAIARVIVYGTPVLPWFDCLADSIRRQLALRGAPAAELDAAIANLATLARDGELNGRSAAYHRQLHAIDIAAAWRGVTARTLVLRGEHDWVVRDDDQARIATLVARDDTAVVDLPGLDHLFGRHDDRAASLRDYGIGRFDPSIGDATVAWLALR